ISNNLAAYTAYLNQGGTFLTNDYAAIYYTNYFGMAPGNYIYNGDLVTNALPGAAAAQGLPSSFAFDYNGGIVMAPPTGTGTDNILTSNTYYSALTSTNVGTGKAYYCAHNYGVSSVPFETVLSNIINSASGNASWATINQYSGNVAAGSSQTVYVKIKSEGLQNGTYRFVAQINTNDPLHKLVNYPISVTVNGTAGISVSSPCVAFGSIMEKTKKTLAKAITNTGCDTLRITSFVSTDAAYSVAPATFNIAPGKTDSAYITFYPQSTGSFPATITVNSNAGSASICVTGTATPAPVITSNPTSVTVNLGSCDEDQAKINITLSNTGQSTLNWTKYNVKKLSDPFDSYNYNIWSNIGGYVGNSCNTYQGSGMEFYYYDRYMITNSFPVYLGELSFYLKTGGCDVAEASKKIRIAYSLNGGFTWVDFMVLDPTAYATTFRKVVATIPAAAYSGATSFKIYQPTHDGTYLDTWTMDNFEIAVSEVDYNTVPNSGTISVGGSRSLTTTITNNGLTGGTYYDTLYFASNDPVNPIYRVPVTTIVSSVPCVNYSYAVGGCSGVVSFSDSTKNAVSTYKWTFGDGGTSTDKSPSHSYTAAGTYSVQLIACNGSGCDTLSKNVVITGVGGPKAACTPDGYTCCGYGIETVLMGDINNTSTVGNLYQDFSCSNSTNVKRGQTYKLRVYTGYSYMDGVVWVDFNNNGAFATNERFVLTSISAYSMEANIVVPSTAVQNTPLRMRILTADYISTPDPCYITYGEFEDYSLNVTSGVGIDEQYHTETPVNIYPNPATTAINISLGEQFPIDQVDILDAVGRIVLTQKENGNTASLVQVGDLAKGNYIVRITSSGNTYHRQFSKQ
ncbi:MAG: PKD domain-containing protein, partial [Bacteroidota bacterium]